MSAVATVSALGLRSTLTGRPPWGLRRAGRNREEYGTSWASLAAEQTSGTGPRGASDRGAALLWGLLGLAAVLFWVTLSRAAPDGRTRLTGTQLVDALPPATVAHAAPCWSSSTAPPSPCAARGPCCWARPCW